MKLFKWPNILLTLVIAMMIVGFTVGYFISKRSDELMKNTYSTTAIVEPYGTNMGAHYINYKFKCMDVWYKGSHPTSRFMVSQIPVGTNDLQIEYAVEAPELSRIVDKRFE
jgi:uncharacterized protein YneF (UPF0154 family)